MSAFRTQAGGRIDRSKPLSFRFDGRAMQGYAGDTLASALLANGVHLVGRSFKYHRPRGVMAAGMEEPNALVTVKRDDARITPNLRATEIALYEGLTAFSQNRWPSLGFDMGAINSLIAPFLGAGFYYKTFMGPKILGATRLWAKLYEPFIRRAAGLGVAPNAPDPDTYASHFAHCEVLVVGGGQASLKAALEASENLQTRVILAELEAECGGALLTEASTEEASWLSDTLATLEARDNVTILTRTQAFGAFAQNFIALQQRLTDHLANPPADAPRERLWQVRAAEVVFATGAIERPLVFPENDRPGIMLADAAKTYALRYGALPGRSGVVLTACDTAYHAAFALKKCGVDIVAIIDLRPAPGKGLAEAARALGIPVHLSSTITGTKGHLRVKSVSIGTLTPDGGVRAAGNLPCDLVLMSGGFTPVVHLFSQSRGRLAWNEALKAFLPGEHVPNQRSVGAAAGDMPEAMRGGVIGASPHGRDSARVKAFVDFQNDVCAKDIALAAREGFHSIEHVKRYTTTGMATDQGKTSNMNSLGLVAEALGKDVPAIGLTTFRQPYTPVTFGLFAGESRGEAFDPIRKTPLDAALRAAGAAFEDVGLWKRAHYFPEPGEDMHAAVNRECVTTRSAVGLFDASTLGKIELCGPDAAEFLERMYLNPWKKLEIGRARYGILCNEAGFVIDDGVIGRLAEDRFHITTTTGGAARVFSMFEDYLQTEFTDLTVWQTSITEEWAVIAVQGPRARDVLAPLVEGIDLAREAFPHMALREGRIAGVKTRLFRVSFSGELGFEVNVPAAYGRFIWDRLWLEAKKHGGCRYGTEAMHVLRAEKGYLIVGQDTDGTMTPDDAGLAWAIGKAKRDFVGKRGMMMPDNVAKERKEWVGLEALDSTAKLEEGAQIVATATPALGEAALGHITSCYWSANLGRIIAQGVVKGGRAKAGEVVYAPMPGGVIPLRITSPIFYDPKGERLDG